MPVPPRVEYGWMKIMCRIIRDNKEFSEKNELHDK